MSIILTALACYIAINLILGNGPRWTAITWYWGMVTIKNAMDAWRRRNG